MARGKKKFALIWWVGTSEKNVIPLCKILKKDRTINCTTTLVWGEGKSRKPLKAKVISIGEDEIALENIPLTDEGIIADVSTKIFSSEVLSSQKETSKETQLAQAIKKSNQRRVNSKINSDRPIFTHDGARALKRQRSSDLDDTRFTQPASKVQKKKLNVGDSARMRRGHSTTVVSGGNVPTLPHQSQTQRVKTPLPTNSEIASSGEHADSHVKHQLDNRDDPKSRMGMSSESHGGQWYDPFPATRNQGPQDFYRHPSPGQSGFGRPPLFSNSNEMRNHMDASYWNHQTHAQTLQQGNFPMWAGSGYPVSDECNMSYNPPLHQQHHYRPQQFSMGSENYHPESTAYYGGMHRPSHPPAAGEMDSFPSQQILWNSPVTVPQPAGQPCSNESEGHGKHSRGGHQPSLHSTAIISDERPTVPENWTEGTVFTPLTPFEHSEQSIQQDDGETISTIGLMNTPSDMHELASGQINDTTTRQGGVTPEKNLDGALSDHVAQGSPIDISSTDQPSTKETDANDTPNRSGDDFQNKDEEEHLSIDSDEDPELMNQSFDDWRQTSDEEAASNAADGENFDYDNINRMACSLAPFLPKPAPQELIDFHQAILLALQLNDEKSRGPEQQTSVSQRPPLYNSYHKHRRAKQQEVSQLPPLRDDYYKPGENKEEIAINSGFYMEKDKLSLGNLMATKEGEFDWQIFVPAILDMVYGPSIGEYCAQGKRDSGRPGICKRLYNGLYSRICSMVQKTGNIVDQKDYTHRINRIASNKRKPA